MKQKETMSARNTQPRTSRSRYNAIPRRSNSSSRERSRSRSPIGSESSLSSNLEYHHNHIHDLTPTPKSRKKLSLPRIPRLRLRYLLKKPRRLLHPLPLLLIISIFLLWQLLLNSSYALSSAPPFDLRKSENETVFIAANIIDGNLISGSWGESLIGLVEAIGTERVWVSVFGGPRDALDLLREKLDGVGVERERVWIVSEEEEPLDGGRIPRTELPTGESRVKRIAWLAGVRNRVLEPLYEDNGKERIGGGGGDIKPDKLLFLNDVFFDPSSALRLLWGTNLDTEGVARYKAVCAVDFVESWKFYDTFATRDAEGYSIGVPVFPWFVNEGEARSRRDVLEGRDAVRVKSCWGGMVAFDGRYFRGRGGEREEGMNVDGGYFKFLQTVCDVLKRDVGGGGSRCDAYVLPQPERSGLWTLHIFFIFVPLRACCGASNCLPRRIHACMLGIEGSCLSSVAWKWRLWIVPCRYTSVVYDTPGSTGEAQFHAWEARCCVFSPDLNFPFLLFFVFSPHLGLSIRASLLTFSHHSPSNRPERPIGRENRESKAQSE